MPRRYRRSTPVAGVTRVGPKLWEVVVYVPNTRRRACLIFTDYRAAIDFKAKWPNVIRQPTGTVYFIEPIGGGLIKIGYTAGDVARRLADLQTGSPVPLRLVATLPGTFQDEALLHSHFADRRHHGEWFDLDLGDLPRQLRILSSLLSVGGAGGDECNRPTSTTLSRTVRTESSA